VYAFVLEGKVSINGQDLDRRDGLGVWDLNAIDIEATSKVEILIMEVPMNIG
jgi:redox-sensitive bicupin YhaK (pirin superfamily)